MVREEDTEVGKNELEGVGSVVRSDLVGEETDVPTGRESGFEGHVKEELCKWCRMTVRDSS